MRRIILALSTLALTACADAPPNANVDAASGDTGTFGRDVATDTSPAAPDRIADDRGTVLFLGTSLTAGYGVGEAAAFPALIQAKIDSAGLPFHVDNAGLSGETSAGGLRRLDWVLQNPIDVFVLELGANDGLRGIDPAEMRRNLDAILTRTYERYPDASLVIAGMQAPPNLGAAYTSRFQQVFRDLAVRHDAALVPFLLDGVAGVPSLNTDDGMHPNAAGHERIAATVWETLEPVLRARAH